MIFQFLKFKSLKSFLKKINIFDKLKYNIVLDFSKEISGLKFANRGIDFILSFSKSNFISFVIRPKNSKNFKLISTEKIDIKEFGIIIQGPINNKKEFNFINETIEIYKNFPKYIDSYFHMAKFFY